MLRWLPVPNSAKEVVIFLGMGLWKIITSAFGTHTPPDARRLSADNEGALSASIKALSVGERGWITLSEARALFSPADDQCAFGEMDEVGRTSLAVFAESGHRSSILCPPRQGFTSPEKRLDSSFPLCSHRQMDELPFKIVKMHGAKDEVIARVENFLICKAAFEKALFVYPTDHLEMRQGARIILKSKEELPPLS
jgi:hypothetical protein